MRKGPRGGGRDRDHIVRHVLGVEQDWARKVGVRAANDDMVVVDAGPLAGYREAYVGAIRRTPRARRRATGRCPT